MNESPIWFKNDFDPYNHIGKQVIKDKRRTKYIIPLFIVGIWAWRMSPIAYNRRLSEV